MKLSSCTLLLAMILLFCLSCSLEAFSGGLHERGILQSLSEVPVTFSASGKIKWLISESSWVKKGDLIAELDLESLETQVKEFLEMIEDKKAEVENIRQLLVSKVEEQKMSLSLSQKEWEYAILSLDTLKNGTKPDDLELSLIRIDLAKIELERAKESFTRQENLIEKGFVAKSSLESLALRVKSREVRVADVERQHARLTEPPELEQTLEQEALVRRWEGKVNRAELKHRRELASIELELLKQEEELSKMNFELSQKESGLRDTKIFAPTEGLVVLAQKRDWSRGGAYVPIFVGLSVYERDLLANVIDPSRMQVTLTVHEKNIHEVSLGAIVNCRIPALNHEVFTGKVFDTSALGSDLRDLLPLGEMNDDHGQVYFNVLIRLDRQDERFMPGMSSIVVIPKKQ